MADDRSDIYIDLSFFSETDASADTRVDLQYFVPDNIGQRTVRVEVRSPSAADAGADLSLEYITSAAQEYATNVALEYNAPSSYSSTENDYLVNFSTGALTSGTLDLSTYYRFFNTVSGTIDGKIAFISGKEYLDSIATAITFTSPTMLSGVLSYLNNYTNFSGDYTEIGGFPVPYKNTDFDIISTTELASVTTSGSLDTYLDLFFAGWVTFFFDVDLYCSLQSLVAGPKFDYVVISGSLDAHYLDVFSTSTTTSGLNTDCFCSLIDFVNVDYDVETLDGRIGYLTKDVFSTIENKPGLNTDIDLFSLKITNFSLEENQFIEATGFISVDVVDDVCPVSVSGTKLLVNDEEVFVTLSGIDNGYRIFYDPADDFENLSGPTTFTVHAENECGKSLEEDFYLTFGYIVENINELDYGYGNQIAVRISAENMASCPKAESVAYIFETDNYKEKDLGASIVGKFHASSTEILPASIYPQSTAYFYEKEFEIIVRARDFAGNEMEPFVLKYKIENKPSQ